MKISWIAFITGFCVAAGGSYLVMTSQAKIVFARVGQLESEVSTKDSELLGYTKYTSYLTLGKQSLGEQTKLLTASVSRNENVTQVIENSTLGFSSTATVAVWYKAEYSFGFDLRPNNYDVKAVPTGIEIHIGKPALITTPAVTNLRYRILSNGLFTNAKGAVIRLYEGASQQAQEQGLAMTADAAIGALCEKKLIEFLRDFLARQPGVKVVPNISVVYEVTKTPL